MNVSNKEWQWEKSAQNVCTHITSKWIELESQVWSGFEFLTKPDQPGLSNLIRLEVVMEWSCYIELHEISQIW